MQEIPEHELINILIELVREKLIQAETSCRLFAIHPSIWLFGLISQSRSDLGSHPLEGIVILNDESNEPPNRVDSLDWL